MSQNKNAIFQFTIFALIGLVLFLSQSLNNTIAAQPLQKITVSKEKQCFVNEKGEVYIPWGLTYFRPGTGWAPKIWRMFDPQATRKDFTLLKQMGVNCVRVFLTYGEFFNQPDKLNENGLRKLDEFLKIAEETGIYVHPTGPDHWEGLPSWAQGDRISDEKILSALEKFWYELASRYKGRNVIFAYDLLNEPSVPFNSSIIKEKWRAWIVKKYGSLEKAAEVFSIDYKDDFTVFTPERNAKPSKLLIEYQKFRESVAVEWVKRQVDAIKNADPNALVTVGLIQWSVPLFLSSPSQYAGFRPSLIAPYLDFMEIHFYPLVGGAYTYKSEEDELKNLAYLEAIVREVAMCGKPAVLAEYGWYGGGTLPSNQSPPASEEQQAQFCEKIVKTSRGWVNGWLHWGMYDHPEAKDVTRSIGLFKEDGKIKEWGKTYSRIGNELSKVKAPFQLPDVKRPTMDWDTLIINIDRQREFFKEYYKSFKGE